MGICHVLVCTHNRSIELLARAVVRGSRISVSTVVPLLPDIVRALEDTDGAILLLDGLQQEDAAIDLSRVITRACRDAAVVFIGRSTADRMVALAVVAGCRHYVTPYMAYADLLGVLEDVCTGRCAKPDSAFGSMLAQVPFRTTTEKGLALMDGTALGLPEAVARCVGLGLSRTVIAQWLGRSDEEVSTAMGVKTARRINVWPDTQGSGKNASAPNPVGRERTYMRVGVGSSLVLLLALITTVRVFAVRKYAVAGSVYVDKAPVEFGTVTFDLKNAEKSHTAGGPIQEGQFIVPSQNGLMSGTYRVTVVAFKRRLREQAYAAGTRYQEMERIALNEDNEMLIVVPADVVKPVVLEVTVGDK